jgi:hypothetical protein
MALKVSDEAIEKTTKCSWNYGCLDDNSPKCSANKSICKVKHAVDKFLFINWNHEDCSYKLPLGDDFLCTCPVRIEIYKSRNM